MKPSAFEYHRAQGVDDALRDHGVHLAAPPARTLSWMTGGAL